MELVSGLGGNLLGFRVDRARRRRCGDDGNRRNNPSNRCRRWREQHQQQRDDRASQNGQRPDHGTTVSSIAARATPVTVLAHACRP